MKIVLRDELHQLWKNKDPFEEVQGLKGFIVREKEGRQTLRFDLANKTYYRKLHRGIGWKEVWKNIFQGRMPIIGATNEWLAINRLHQLGIDSLNTVGFGKKGINPAKQLSFIITEELTNTISLAKFAESWPTHPPSYTLKRALIEKVATISRRIHENGINHRDLYICHFLLDRSSALNPLKSSDIRLYLVDLHRAQIRSSVPCRWLVKDMASLYFSSVDTGITARDVMRFLRIYFQSPIKNIFDQRKAFLLKVKKRATKLYLRDFGQLPQFPL